MRPRSTWDVEKRRRLREGLADALVKVSEVHGHEGFILAGRVSPVLGWVEQSHNEDGIAGMRLPCLAAGDAVAIVLRDCGRLSQSAFCW